MLIFVPKYVNYANNGLAARLRKLLKFRKRSQNTQVYNAMKKSPFPGMNPYLEGNLWPDVHSRLASVIAELLAPHLAPKYVARIEIQTTTDRSQETEVGIMYPDVSILEQIVLVKEPTMVHEMPVMTATLPTAVIADIKPIEVRIPVVEIRDTAQNRLVTAIEVLSPVNKKNPGYAEYQEKRRMLHVNGVHLLEIDLLRRGARPMTHPSLPKSDYAMFLMRAGRRKTEVWAVNLKDTLPILPVPLADDDPDVLLNLPLALELIYERSLYHLSIDYQQQPPPPELTEADREWMSELIAQN